MAPDIKLDADQQAVALKTIHEAQYAIGTIADEIKRTGAVDADLAKNILRVSEHCIASLGRLLAIPTQTAHELDERNRLLREANVRVRDLENLIGNNQSPETVQLGIKGMADRLNLWWDLEGFGHISSVNFGSFGCEAVLSCHLFGNYSSTLSKTPVSNKERTRLWRQSLSDRGFVIYDDGADACLFDCDRSRGVLVELLSQRLPSASIRSFENRGHHKKGLVLTSVKIFVRDISELLALPVKDESPGATDGK